MKRFLALLLTASMMLGLVSLTGMAAVAAEGKDDGWIGIPDATVSIASDGTVTAKIDGVGAGFEDARVYVQPSGGTGTTAVELTFDPSTGAYTGKDAAAAGGTVRKLAMYHNQSTPSDYESTRYEYEYSEKGGLTTRRFRTEAGSGKDVTYEYTDANGNKQTKTTNVTVKYSSRSASETYDINTGKMTMKDFSTIQYDGDETKRTENHRRGNKYFDAKTGYTNYEYAYRVTEDRVARVRDDGVYTFIPEKSESANEYRYYNSSTGAVSNRNTSEYQYTYDTTGSRELETNWVNVYKSYNQNDKQVLEQTTTADITYNAAKDRKTVTEELVAHNLNSKGVVTFTTLGTTTREYKDGGAGTFLIQSTVEHRERYNPYDELTNTTDNEARYNTDGVQQSSRSTQRQYNTYTGAMVQETVSEGRKGLDDVWVEKISSVRNNDDGTLRCRTEQDYDGSVVYYNCAGQVVATRSADNVWSDASGKVIGKNDLEDGNGTETTVEFKQRTGEIDTIDIRTVSTQDGNSTEVHSRYDGNRKLISETKSVSKADGSEERYDNGVLVYSYDAAGQEYRYFNSQGKLRHRNQYDTATGEWVNTSYNVDSGAVTGTERFNPTTWETNCYNAEGKLVEWYTETGDEKKFDENGQVISEIRQNAGVEEHYGANSQLLYTVKTEIKDDVQYTVYADKDGKEFARTYYKNSGTYQGDMYHNESEWTHVYSVDEEDSDTARFWWDPENQSGRLEKAVSVSDRDIRDGVTTTTYKIDYLRWDVNRGSTENEVTRSYRTEQVTDDDHTEIKEYRDGVLTEDMYTERNEYGKNLKSTTKTFDAYTGEQTSETRYFYDSEPESPFSRGKYYDRYGNLQTYSITDNTDAWRWQKIYYANGSLKQESWNDGLDYDSQYSAVYYLNGNPASLSNRNEDYETYAGFNPEGGYTMWSEKKDDVTNTTYYDGHGNVTGYRWNSVAEGDYSSYEAWDANSLLYTQTYYRDEDTGDFMIVMRDPEGNTLTYTVEGGYELKLAEAGDGWRYAVGSWFWLEDGKPVTSDWRQIDGEWYYFDVDGTMATGLAADTDDAGTENVYVMNQDGTLGNPGWVSMGGNGWAYADDSGKVVTGWQQIDGKWYYFRDGWDYYETPYKADAGWVQSAWRGQMVTGAARIWKGDWSDRHTYFFNADGTWDTTPGWKMTDGINNEVEYHYYDRNGNEVTGWQKIDGKWYLFNEEGVMRNGWVSDGGNWYFLSFADGAMVQDGWAEDIYEGWYHMDKDGTMQTGWVQDGGAWFYLQDSGQMAEDEFIQNGSTTYYVDASGAMQTGWVEKDNKWYYMDADGAMKTGWMQEGANWYYLGADGVMVTGQATVDGKTSNFGPDGVWLGYAE